MNPRVFILAFASFAVGTETYVFAGLLARLAADLQVSVALAGQLAAAFALVYALCAPIAAVVMARFDRKLVLTGALSTLCLLNLVASVMPSFGTLLGMRILCGVAATLVVPIAGAAAVSMVPQSSRGRAMAIVLAGLTLAFLIGIPVGTVIGGTFGWRYSFVFSGILAGVAALVIAAVLPRIPSMDQPGLGALGVVLRKPVALSLTFTVTAFTAMFCIIAFIGPVVTQITDAEGASVGVMQSVVGIGSLLGIILGGRLADRPDTRKAIAISLSVIAVTLANYSALMFGAYDLTPEVQRQILAVMIATGSASLFSLTPIIQARLITAAPLARNVVLAFNGSMIYLGQGLGALLGGATVAMGGLLFLGVVGGTLALFGALLALFSEKSPVTMPTLAAEQGPHQKG